jgi:DNA repair exonuclease SbcCD ATPase subunit
MIRRVVLSNWRAYDDLALDLEPGVTFLVASNGVGKSSLVMGVAWGLFGDASHVDAVKSIRGDADSAAVQVTLELPDSRILEISRTVNTKGKVKTTAKIDGSLIADELKLIEESFGAEPDVLARLTFMSDGGHIASEKEFDLKDHLYKVFGVTNLREAEAEARRLRKLAKDERESIRRVELKKASNRSQLESVLGELDREIAENEAARSDLEDELKAADTARKGAQQWVAYERTVQHREAQIQTVLEATREIAESRDPSAVQSQLLDLEDQLRRQIDKQKDEISSHDARWTLALKAIERLQGSGAVCPTCLRPITPEEASSAIHEHKATSSSIEEILGDLSSGLTELSERMSAIRGAMRQFQEIPGPPLPPQGTRVGLEQAESTYTEVMTRLDAVKEKSLALRNERQQIAGQLDNEEEARAAEIAERRAFRNEAIALATESALKETAERITQERIDPLTQEVARRWKRLFGTGDLILNPSGTIRRRIGSRELTLAELSGGERIWAQLVARLLVLSASTRSPFMWLDEPLEHLDPKLRKMVAGTLVQAGKPGDIRQVVVTTYEDGLARQLVEDNKNARLIVVRSGDELREERV